MMNGLVNRLRTPFVRSVCLALVSMVLMFQGMPAWSYTPDSPKVRTLLKGAISYLEAGGMSAGQANMLGGRALVGLALYKYYHRFGDVSQQLPALTAAALDHVTDMAHKPALLSKENIYSLGIAVIFLTEVKASRHTAEISVYVNELQRVQKPHGGWGYTSMVEGDTSQTQYPVLAMWAAKQSGLKIPTAIMERAGGWVMRTQDPSGGWGYQGRDPGGPTRIPQTEIRPSLVAAGLGSAYVIAHFLGITAKGKRPSASKLPPALIKVVEDQKKGRTRTSIDVGRLKKTMEDGNTWFRRTGWNLPSEYPFYYLYGLERCQSFRELVEKSSEEEPEWYDSGIDSLAKVQLRTGAFGQSEEFSVMACNKPIATAFAVLFMLRSTRETIEKVAHRDGILRGGYGLPNDASEVRLKGNKIVAPAITGTVEDMISMLEDDEADKIENMLDNPDALSLTNLSGSGTEFTARLRRIVQTGSYKARIVAATTLGKQGDLDNAPILIFALTDGDPRVVRVARDGLRRISRRFDGVGLPDNPNKKQVELAVKQWKDWYRSVRPEAVFIE